MKKQFVNKISIITAFLMLVTVFFTIVDYNTADAKVTEAHIDQLRQERRNIQNRMKNVEAQIDSLEFDKMSETIKRDVLQDRILLTGFEIENIVATIEEYLILITDKENQVAELLLSEENHMQLYRERVRSMEESGMITYLEIIFDSTGFADLLARLEFVTDIMNADERIYNNLVSARMDTIAAKEDLVLTMEAMQSEYELLETREAELLMQVDELNEIIANLEQNLEAAQSLHRQLSDEDARMQQTINNRVAELRQQQEREARERAAMNTWGSGSGTSNSSGSSSGSGTSSGSNNSDISDENLKWLAFIIHLEAKNESLQGRIAVGNVIMNRVRSPLFPSTIKAVILAPNQFPPAHSNDIETLSISSGAIDAARRVLNGERADGIGNALYFNRAGAESWASQNRPLIITIGNHDFYG